MTLTILVDGLGAYALVFCRMGGMIFFNPLLMRKNLPSQFKIALVLGLSLLITPTLEGISPEVIEPGLPLLLGMIKELMVGLAFGFVFQIFYYLLFVVGDVVDMGFGLSMAKAFDPGTNLQIPVTGNLFQLLFVLYFFAVDGHLLLIKIMASSYHLVGPGAVVFGKNVASFLLTLFIDTFSLVMHLALPFIVASFVLEIAMGILMKLIPQINVFAIHFQLKILFGFFLLFLFAGPVSEFMDHYIYLMFTEMKMLIEVI